MRNGSLGARGIAERIDAYCNRWSSAYSLLLVVSVMTTLTLVCLCALKYLAT